MIHLFPAIFLTYVVRKVLGDYCEFGTCDENEYCCGENKCCKKTTDIWYYWAGVFLVIIVILSLILWLIRRNVTKEDRYRLIPQQFDSKVPIMTMDKV